MTTLAKLLCAFGIAFSFSTTCHAQDDLLVAPDDAPQFKLGNLAKSFDAGGTILVFNYEQTNPNVAVKQTISIAGKTSTDALTTVSIMEELRENGESGELRIGLRGLLIAESSFEIYLVMSSGGQTYKVSNSVTLGSPGPETKARELSADEKEAIRKAAAKKTPPAKLPAGFVAAANDTPLIPGMPVKAGHYGEWVDAEIISVDKTGWAKMKYPELSSLVMHPIEKWVAVDPLVLEKAKTDPGQFSPSVQVLVGSRNIIPNDAAPLDDKTKLLPGTPILWDYHGMWKEVLVSSADDSTVTLAHSYFGKMKEDVVSRSKLVIKNTVLEKLLDPSEETVTSFQSNLEALSEKSKGMQFGSTKSSIYHKQYPVTIEVPKGAQFVPDDLTIPKGTKLAACYAGKWNPITSISENEDGSLYVHWDEYSDAFDCNMKRDQLIIENSVVRKLKKSRKKSDDKDPKKAGAVMADTEKPEPPKEVEKPKETLTFVEKLRKTKRTWTDSTGQHEVKARFVRIDGNKVTLRTDEGREITLEIAKLSENDRKILARVPKDDK